jgi:hypothetical protein
MRFRQNPRAPIQQYQVVMTQFAEVHRTATPAFFRMTGHSVRGINTTLGGMRFAALVFFAITAFAQSPSFEAAVIKPSLPPEQQKIFHNGVMIDKGRVDMGYQSLEDLIARAYRVSTFQISGPEWMKTTRFDVDAKLPADASDVHVPEMLQAMLAERFGMKAHREDRPTAVYNLIVGRAARRCRSRTIP